MATRAGQRTKRLNDLTNRECIIENVRKTRSKSKRDAAVSFTSSPAKRTQMFDEVSQKKTKKMRMTLIVDSDEIDDESSSVSKNIRSDEGATVITIDHSGTEDETTNNVRSDGTMSPSSLRSYQYILDKVLVNGYCNIAERLKLASPPPCLINFRDCLDNHHKHVSINRAKNCDNIETFLNNENPMLFLHLLDSNLMQNKFPDRKTLHLLFEIILTINEHKDANPRYTVDDVIDSSVSSILSVLSAFPPCFKATNQTYLRLFAAPIPRDGFMAKDGFEKDHGLFMNMLMWMEHLLLDKSSDAAEAMNLSQNSEDFLDYNKWESKTTQKFLFQKHNRNEKINRVFLCMELMVQIMEYDLATYMFKYLRSPNGRVSSSADIPIIGHLLWPHDEQRQINYTMKRTIQLHIDCVSIDFDANKVKILSRLINLMYTTVDLCENKKLPNGHIRYPYNDASGNSRSEHFCAAFHKKLREHPAYGTELYVNVINTIQLPRMKLYLISKFVSELDGHQISLTPKIIHSLLVKLMRHHRVQSNGCVSHDAVTQGEETALGDENATADYPFLKMMRKKKSSSITDRDFTKLLMDALHAYGELYHFEKFKERFVWQEQFKKDVELFSADRPKVKPMKAFTEDYVRKHGQKLIRERLKNAKNDRIFSSEVVNHAHSATSIIYIDVEKEIAHAYRSDLKYYEIVMLDERKVVKRLLE